MRKSKLAIFYVLKKTRKFYNKIDLLNCIISNIAIHFFVKL